MNIEPKVLYKYLDFEGVFKTLKNGTLQLKKPKLFNDPFDMQPAPNFIPVTSEEFMMSAALKVARAIKNNDSPYIRPPPYISMMALERSMKIFDKLSLEEIVAGFTNGKDLAAWDKLLLEQESDIVQGMDRFFVSCFSENSHNLLMWAHYANSHAGAMLQFGRSLGDKRGLLSLVRKVHYSEEPLSLASREDWLSFIENPEVAIFAKEKVTKFLTNKGMDWKYENEWRLVLSDQELGVVDESERVFLNFDPQELEGVYLGYRMTSENKEAILKTCREQYPNVSVYESHKASKSFKVHYKRLD